MQGQNLGLGGRYAILHRHFFQAIHELGDFNLIWTARGACLTCGAYPNRLTTQYLLPLTQNHQANDFVGQEIHGKGDRTTVGALAALKTCAGLIGSGSFKLF